MKNKISYIICLLCRLLKIYIVVNVEIDFDNRIIKKNVNNGMAMFNIFYGWEMMQKLKNNEDNRNIIKWVEKKI